MLSKKDKKQFEQFCFVLYIVALVLFGTAIFSKIFVFTVVGWLVLLSVVYIKYWYIPKNSKKKKNSTVVTSEFSFSKYWDKFIEWLHT